MYFNCIKIYPYFELTSGCESATHTCTCTGILTVLKYNLISNLQVVVRVLHIHVHVDQVGLVSAVSMLTVLVPLTVMTMVFVMTLKILQSASM